MCVFVRACSQASSMAAVENPAPTSMIRLGRCIWIMPASSHASETGNHSFSVKYRSPGVTPAVHGMRGNESSANSYHARIGSGLEVILHPPSPVAPLASSVPVQAATAMPLGRTKTMEHRGGRPHLRSRISRPAPHCLMLPPQRGTIDRLAQHLLRHESFQCPPRRVVGGMVLVGE